MIPTKRNTTDDEPTAMNAKSLGRIERLNYILGGVMAATAASTSFIFMIIIPVK